MPIGPLLRPRGRHVRPSRTGQPLVAGMLAASLGGPIAALAVSGAAAADPPSAVLAGATTATPDDLVDRGARRVSRDRPASPPPVPAPVLAPPVAPPPPPPPPPVPPVLPGCAGEATEQYANGRIPQSALCAVPGNPGHRLRADAARAFVALAEAYRADTGKKLCITDTYRSYEAQVRLRWAKRGLAATPGRSNHGTGTAVDFCGGIESFGTSAHRWMKARAGEFGWVHPAWARPGGRKPEPWHWEYRG